MGVRAGHSAKPEPASRLGQKASVPDADYSHLTTDDFDYDLGDCWNCGGEGWVYGCPWGWQCDTWDGDSCLCTHPCHICFPPKPDPELSRILAQAIEAEGGDAKIGSVRKDESAIRKDAPGDNS